MSTTISNPSVVAQASVDFTSGRITGSVLHRAASTPSVGTPAGSVDLSYTKDFIIASGTPLSLDLTSLIDPAGNTIVFGHLTHYVVENLSIVSGENIAIGGGTNGVFTADPKTIRANGGFQAHVDANPGITVDGTHKIFTLTAATGTGVLGRLTLLGRSV